RTEYLRINNVFASLKIDFLDMSFVRIGILFFLYLQDTFIIDLVFELAQPAVEGLFESKRIAEPQVTHIENRFDQIGDVICERYRNVVVHQSGNERCVSLNGVFNNLRFRDGQRGVQNGGNRLKPQFPVSGDQRDAYDQQQRPDKPDIAFMNSHSPSVKS